MFKEKGEVTVINHNMMIWKKRGTKKTKPYGASFFYL